MAAQRIETVLPVRSVWGRGSGARFFVLGTERELAALAHTRVVHGAGPPNDDAPASCGHVAMPEEGLDPPTPGS